MKLTILPTILLAILFSPSLVLSHGDESPEALTKRSIFVNQARRSLNACLPKLRERGLYAARIEKRENMVEKRFGEAKRKHKRRDWTDKYDVSSLYSKDKKSGSCILAPEATIGPYYLSTHLFRHDLRSTPLQPGIEFLLTAQFVDVNTCNPVTGVTAEFWNANYLGVYSGFKVEGTVNDDFLRGMQTSDEHGIVQVVTNFPGWYSGRAVHIHLAAHLNGTLVVNDKDVASAKKGQGKFYTGGTVPHIGQFFFEEDLLKELEKAEPYNKHTNVTRLENSGDNIYTSGGSSVQIMNVRYIEEGKITGGLVGDIVVGIDLSKNYPAQASDPEGNSTIGGPPPSTGNKTTTSTSTGTASVSTQTGEAVRIAQGAVPMMVAMGLGWLVGN